jgi:cytochrome c-type biogenesis protein
MSDNVTVFAAFIAGLLSFVSPCVLPLIPGYLSFISGVTLDQMQAASVAGGQVGVAVAAPAGTRRRVIVTSLLFVLGFSLVFVGLGASATAVGQFLAERLRIIGKIAGLIVIVFGLHTMGLLKISWLYSEKRMQLDRKPAGPLGAVLVGVAFAFGWTPCIGPILAGILTIAAAQDQVMEGVKLLAVYSLGLGVPFLLTALAINQFFTVFARIRKYYYWIELVSGALLVVIGVLIFTDRFTIIARWLSPYLPTF